MKKSIVILLISLAILVVLGLSISIFFSTTRYTETSSSFSFLLPRSIRPIASSENSFQEFQQFSVPSYVNEGMDMFPYLQVSTYQNVDLSIPNSTTKLSLGTFLEKNLLTQFGENPSITRLNINGREQLRACSTNGVRLCNAIMKSKDETKVISFILGYPIQGPRSTNNDEALEKAYSQMLGSVKFD